MCTPQTSLPSCSAGQAKQASEMMQRCDVVKGFWRDSGNLAMIDVNAVVVMQEAGYEEALKCDGTELDGQQLRVQKCISAGQHGAKKKQGQAPGALEASPGVQTQQPAAPKVPTLQPRNKAKK